MVPADRRPPKFCLGIPFRSEEEIYECALALPWHCLPHGGRAKRDVTGARGNPLALAEYIAKFFSNARPDIDFPVELEYCYLNFDGETPELDRLPVLCFHTNHLKSDEPRETRNRQRTQEAIEEYLAGASEVWAEKQIYWILSSDVIAHSHGDDVNLCPLCP